MRCRTGFADLPPIPSQPCRALCWATCLAYVLRGYGAVIGEADVLTRADLDDSCRPGHDASLLRAGAGLWTDREGRRFRVFVTALPGIDAELMSESRFDALLSRLARQPLLCGSAGHTTVLAEIRTRQDGFGRRWREGATVADPYAPSRGTRALTEAEMARPAYVLGVSVRPV